MKRLIAIPGILALVLCGVPAAAQAPSAQSGAPVAQASKIQPFPGVLNFAPVDDTYACGGATSLEAVAELKKRGYKAVVNFRPADEQGANVEQEKAAVIQAGMKFIWAPFRRTDANIDTAVDAFLAAAKDPANRPMFFHCAAGVRASAMWFFKRVLVDGWTVEKALPEAESIGLGPDAVKQWAVAYLKTRGK